MNRKKIIEYFIFLKIKVDVLEYLCSIKKTLDSTTHDIIDDEEK